MMAAPDRRGKVAARDDASASIGRVGVVDIGSNTVRLVVYEAPTRLPIPVFNEKTQCALGSGLAATGRLSVEGVERALRSLDRFVHLSRAMDVARLELVATAAVRDAVDGADFVRRVEERCGLPVHVLSGAEEARLAAVGLLSGVADADGVLGDLGGGSLDLVGMEKGRHGAYASLHLGHLRLAEESGGDLKKARHILSERLATAPWLTEASGRTLYAVGGSWRTLARLFIEQTNYPLHVIDNYSIGFFEALRLADLIAHLSHSTLEKVSGVSRRRLDTLPFAALALAALLETARPSEVVFSGFGMREGQMLELLPEGIRRQDPLISACERQAERNGRFSVDGGVLLDWTAPLFADEGAAARRLRWAACLLSDIGWSEHPDYRALHAYHRVLRVPYAGLNHADRAQLALAVLVRYGGDRADPMVAPVQNLLTNEQLTRAQVIGLSLRLAHKLSGSAADVLAQTTIGVENSKLVLELPGDGALFFSESVDRPFRSLARAMGLKTKLRTGGDQTTHASARAAQK